MRKITRILFGICTLLLSNSFLFAQTNDSQSFKFEKGTVILENGTELDALIKVEKWNLNPTEVIIKKNEDIHSETLKLDEIRSFTIPGKVKYIRRTIQIDTSRNPDIAVSEQKEPTYNTRTVLLKVLVDGKASLYSYRSNELHQHFYFKTPQTDITYLEHKVYLATPGTYYYNNEFRYQLYSRLNCENKRMSKVPKIEYTFDDLIDYVVSYNKCTDSEIIKYEFNKPRDIVKFYLSVGQNSTGFTMYYSRLSATPNLKLDYGSLSYVSLNGGTEWILPLKSNDWSFLTGISYQTYEASAIFKSEPYIGEQAKIVAENLNLMAELRKYFQLDQQQQHSLFVSGAIGYSINSTSHFHFDHMLFTAEFRNAPIYQLSAGYMWRKLVFAKISYTPPYDTFDGSPILESKMSSLRFGIGLSL